MPAVASLLSALDERTIAQRVAIPHDEARMRYPLRSNTVHSFEEFADMIGDYYNFHFTTCVSRGGSLSRSEATSRAKRILAQEYRRQNGDVVSAYNDAHDGTNGGLRVVLDRVTEGIKAESVENYIRDIFDRHVAPNSWEDKVAIIRQFIAQCGAYLSTSIDVSRPERYASNYEELIRGYVRALQQSSATFRRL